MVRAHPILAVLCLWLTVFALPVAAPSGAVAADGAADAGAFVQSLGERAITHLTSRDMNLEQRDAKFREILRENFDLDRISRFVLGRYWRAASAEQKTEFRALFEDFIVRAYAKRFGEYSGEILKVNQVREQDQRGTMVQSTIIRKNGPPVRVDWRLATPNSGYKVTDVVVEGISMGLTHRDEFASVIRNNGGKLDGLLAALRRKSGK